MTLEELKRVTDKMVDPIDDPLGYLAPEIMAMVDAIGKVKKGNAGGYIDDDFGEIESAYDAFNSKMESIP